MTDAQVLIPTAEAELLLCEQINVLQAAIKDITARIVALTAANEWRPIEMAPKTETIMLWTVRGLEIGRWNTDEFSKKPRPYWNWHSYMGKTEMRQCPPTHWKPMPEGPAYGYK